MVHDWGSRDAGFIAINKMVLDKIAERSRTAATHFVTVPMQGSGTFAVEAMITTLRAARRQAAGADQRRLRPARQENRADRRPRRRPCSRRRRTRRPISRKLETVLADDKAITHVFAVHCETTSGILNPIAEIAALVARHGRRLLVDSMSAFGALRARRAQRPYDAVAASSNKCSKACRGWASSSAARPRWTSARATPPRWCSTCTTRPRFRQDRAVPFHAADPRHRGASKAIEECEPKAASPAAASATARTAAC